MNPVAYLLVSLAFTSVMLTVVFFIAWLSFGRRRYALLWSLAFLFAALQWVLNLSSRSLPLSFPAYWLIVSLASVLTLSLGLAAFRLRAGLPNKIGWYVFGAAVDLGAIAWFVLVREHTGLRTGIGPLYAAVIMGLCIHAIAHTRRLEPADWGMLVTAGIFGACEALAGVAMISGGAAGTQASLELYRAVNFLSLPAAYTGMGLFTVLILASDLSKEMKQLALSDSLTGVMNRRGFTEAAGRALAAARRKGAPLSAIVCDVDHFKLINDRHGHAIGDRALQQFTQHLQRNARPQDAIGRIGGEEFAVLLPDTAVEVATAIAERLRTTLAGMVVSHEAAAIQMQASFGVAALRGDDEDILHLIERADAALYRSKRDGRDRVTVA